MTPPEQVPPPSSNWNDRTAAKLRAAMAEQKITSTDVALRMGVGARWVQRRVAGEVELSLREILWLANAIGVDVDTVIH
jgi:transcriptional regulator with XRE-family HTH domain